MASDTDIAVTVEPEENIIQVKSSAKTTDEIEADIAATVHELERLPVAEEPPAKPAQKKVAAKLKATAKPKAAPKKRRAVKEAPVEEEGERIPVIKHSGKVIKPLNESIAKPEPKPVAKPAPKPVPAPASDSVFVTVKKSPPKPAPVPEPKPAEPMPEPAPKPVEPAPVADTAAKPDSISGGLEARAAAKPAEASNQQQAKVFDTRQYHLPIKPSHHHRQHAVPPVVSVLAIGLTIVLAAAVAADMGLFDPGFKLPFDYF